MSSDAIVTTPSTADASVTMTGQFGLYELRSGDVLGNRFRIVSMLGVGGMGVVYRARDQSLDVDVAIKLLRPELARRPESFERFRQELLLARQVSSPHVVRIHDIAEQDGRWFISMDFIDGDSLEHRLDQAGRLPTDEALRVTHDLLDGLAAAQQRGVVHRDLKPANILIDSQGHAYITDFGVARSLGSTGLTHSGVIIGTPEYLSPEQARGESVDARSDLYAVGLILYEMLTGTLPFAAGTPAETVMQRIVRPPPSLARARPDLPGWLQAFADRLLKLNPAHRFANARDALHALDTKKIPRPPIDRRVAFVGVLASVFAVGAALFVYNYPWKTAPSTAVVSSIPTWAMLPIATADEQLAPIARAFDEHLTAWARGDSGVSVVPRRRVQMAISRIVPDANSTAVQRLSKEVAAAANANHWISGTLQRDGDRLSLELSAQPDAPNASPMKISGGDVAELLDAYLKAAPTYFAAHALTMHEPPSINPSSFADFGATLIDLDQHRYDAAAKIIDSIAPKDNASALVATALLTTHENSNADLPAQNDRDSIAKEFAARTDPISRELVARALSENGDDEKAQQSLDDALHAFPNDPALTLAEADLLRERGQGEKAIVLLKTYLKSADDDAHAWFLLGRTAIEHGDPSDAVEDYLLHAQTLNTLARDTAGEAETRNAIGIGYERLGQLDAAAEQYQRAVAIREKLGDNVGLAKSLRNLAIVQAELGHRDDAEKTLTRVSTLLESLGDRASIADLYNDRGVVAEEAGDFSGALKFYRDAYALRQQLDNPTALAESLNNIAFCSYRMGDFDNASAYWNQAMEQYRKLDDHNRMLQIQQGMGLLDVARGQFAAARKELTESQSYAEQHQLPEEIAVSHVSLTELNLLEGRYADAQNSADQAARIYARRSDELGSAESALLQARVAISLGDSENAKKLIDAIDPHKLNAEQLAEFQLASAQFAAISEDHVAQAAHLDEAAKSADKAHSDPLKTRVDLERVRMSLAKIDLAAANASMATVRAQNRQLNNVPLRLDWLELEIALALRNDNAAQAAANYRQALPLLRNVENYSRADFIHAMGALAFANDRTQSEAASKAAAAEKSRVLAATPEGFRASLTTQMSRRWHDETGRSDGF